ncbi:MAG TPA: trehalose-6-phosphate synthase [Gemmatimonadales bacterium]|jgi:trehalose 6-phosphate synthase
MGPFSTPPRVRSQTSRSFRAAVIIAVAFGLGATVLKWHQTEVQKAQDVAEVDRRARDLANGLLTPVREALARHDSAAALALTPRLEGFGKVIGFAVYRSNGQLFASARAVKGLADTLPTALTEGLKGESEAVAAARWQGLPVRLFAIPVLGEGGGERGVLVVVHDVSYISDLATQRLTRSAFWILFLMLLLMMLVVATTWLVYDRQLHKLAEWMRRLRTENVPESPPPGLPVALLVSESNRLAASLRAARSVGLSESEAAVRAEQSWTRDRLRTRAVAVLKHGQLIVVSNREPYLHRRVNGRLQVTVPPGGLVSALDPVLQACGGLWVADGSGDADRETADQFGRLTVPPDDARYTLRRVWLTKQEEHGYYYGFANEGLWPLCHLAHERPVFRAEDWEQYVKVNQRFADTVVEEMGAGNGMVLVQDYQLALVPQMVKAARPDLRVGLFWHIPWPNPESFRICPYRAELLNGILGADLVGFHLQQYCNNFLDTIDRMLETRVDRDHFAIESRGHTAHVRAFPISVESWRDRAPTTEATEILLADIRDRYLAPGTQLGVGVDRIDYTKGIPERFRAIGRFFERYPQHRERFTFVQIGAPSRTDIGRYRDLVTEIERLAREINDELQTDTWKPIHLLVGQADGATVHAFLRLASTCIVSSLHDGMNLVAKEYVAAQEHDDGVLILSEFAGAARELSDALIINPYDIDRFADAIRAAVEMPPTERRERMQRMHREVEEHNVYRWAANLLTALAAIDPMPSTSTLMSSREITVPA